MSRSYYDDNYGHWRDMEDDPEAVAFYHQVQRNSVWKKCRCCKRRVKLRRDYDMCNACAEKAERGWDY